MNEKNKFEYIKRTICTSRETYEMEMQANELRKSCGTYLDRRMYCKDDFIAGWKAAKEYIFSKLRDILQEQYKEKPNEQ